MEMTKRPYKRATTLRERRLRMLVGLIIGVLSTTLYIPMFVLLSLLDSDSPVLKPLLLIVVVGIPLSLGIVGELWMGRRRLGYPSGRTSPLPDGPG